MLKKSELLESVLIAVKSKDFSKQAVILLQKATANSLSQMQKNIELQLAGKPQQPVDFEKSQVEAMDLVLKDIIYTCYSELSEWLYADLEREAERMKQDFEKYIEKQKQNVP